MDRYIGRLLDGRYEILEVIGTGGMAVVYKARCHRLNRFVAIKILKDEYTRDEEFRSRFHAESQAVAMLNHSNIVSVHDVSTSDEADYIVMELIDGITLKQYMEKKGVLNWKETLHFAIQIAKALEHAHSRGIIHRDIKPHNVMVLKNGSVRVADFGIARVMSKSNTLTKEALGSVHYISPEQAKGGRVDNRSDLYSLGVVMYEMMTGRPPYDGESPVAVAIQHINGKAAMPSTLNPNMPGGLEQIIMKAMATEPGKRYATATQMLYDMDEFRKDPTLLFDYNNASAGVEATVLLQKPAPQEKPAPRPARTTAEQVAAKKERTAEPKPKPAKPQTPPKKRVRPREEIVEDDNHHSWVATIAIVLCVMVAVAAIGVFIYALMGSEPTPTLVEVPNVVGKPFNSSAVSGIKDLTFHEERIYSEEIPVGEIIEQNPVGGTHVEKGFTVTVKVSLGPRPQKLMMENLLLLEEATALKFLKETQGIPENRILVHYENSDTVTAGLVLRTEPEKNGTITDDTVISIYVSKGKEVKTNKVPNVLNKNIEIAEKMLNFNGFKNVIREEVDSSKTKGTVIAQSEDPNTEISVETVIILQVSKGQEVIVTPPNAPTAPDETLYIKVVTVDLPEDMMEPYVLSLRRNGETIAKMQMPAGALKAQFELRGEGVLRYEVWLGETLGWTIDVDFTRDSIAPTEPPEKPTEPTVNPTEESRA